MNRTEREGFEPPSPLGTHAFEACAIAVLPPLRRGPRGPCKQQRPNSTEGRGIRAIALLAGIRRTFQSGRPDYLRFAAEIRSLPQAQSTGFRRVHQSGRPDSNRGPLRPERSALPD